MKQSSLDILLYHEACLSEVLNYQYLNHPCKIDESPVVIFLDQLKKISHYSKVIGLQCYILLVNLIVYGQ